MSQKENKINIDMPVLREWLMFIDREGLKFSSTWSLVNPWWCTHKLLNLMCITGTRTNPHPLWQCILSYCDAFNLISRFYGWWCCKKSKMRRRKIVIMRRVVCFPTRWSQTYLTRSYFVIIVTWHILLFPFIAFQLMVLAINNFFNRI